MSRYFDEPWILPHLTLLSRFLGYFTWSQSFSSFGYRFIRNSFSYLSLDHRMFVSLSHLVCPSSYICPTVFVSFFINRSWFTQTFTRFMFCVLVLSISIYPTWFLHNFRSASIFLGLSFINHKQGFLLSSSLILGST